MPASFLLIGAQAVALLVRRARARTRRETREEGERMVVVFVFAVVASVGFVWIFGKAREGSRR